MRGPVYGRARWKDIAGVLLVLVSTAGFPSCATAEGSFGVSDVLEDAKLYVTAPIRWDAEDWAFFGGAALAIVGSHQFDQKVRDHFATGPHSGLNGGKDKNSVRDALPSVALIAGTGLFAVLSRNASGYEEAWSLLEAGIFSAVTAELVGIAGGRERPDGTTSPNQWRSHGDSFPSLHTSAAFAIGTVFAESGSDDYRWVRRILGYGIASATAYIRVKDNVHWLSDTVAGAALGVATAHFVLERQDAREEARTSFEFGPSKNGWSLSFAMRIQ